MQNKELKDKLLNIMYSRNMTQTELAQEVGLTHPYFSFLLNSKKEWSRQTKRRMEWYIKSQR